MQILSKEDSNLFINAANGDDIVLYVDGVEDLSDMDGNTPLHVFAIKGENGIEILNHDMVSVVKNNNGDTPLHSLAANKNCDETILEHPDVMVVKNNYGQTPYDIYFHNHG